MKQINCAILLFILCIVHPLHFTVAHSYTEQDIKGIQDEITAEYGDFVLKPLSKSKLYSESDTNQRDTDDVLNDLIDGTEDYDDIHQPDPVPRPLPRPRPDEDPFIEMDDDRLQLINRIISIYYEIQKHIENMPFDYYFSGGTKTYTDNTLQILYEDISNLHTLPKAHLLNNNILQRQLQLIDLILDSSIYCDE